VPTQTLFGHPITLTAACREQNVTYYLDDEDGDAGSMAPFLRTLPGRPAQAFHANLVVTREPLRERDLAAFAEERKRAIAEKLKVARPIRGGRTSVAGLEACEQEYLISLDPPLPALGQWHLFTVRDGFAVHACGTARKDRYEKQKGVFRALLQSWK
jgi:hypothetical protein